jgi:hypothetical protein
MYLYQLLVHLDHCAQYEMDDPLPPLNYWPVLSLGRVVSPLAGTLGRDVVQSIFDELRIVHAPRWEQTLLQLEADLGISANELELGVPDPETRPHYLESSPAQLSRQPQPTARDSLFHGELEKTIKVCIKRTRHRPELSDLKPRLTRK